MINLSLDDLKLIAQIRNLSEYKNNSKEDLIKALSEWDPKPKPKTKLKRKPKTKLKPGPKIEIKVNRKKLEKLRKDFDELRHKFSNKDEIKEYRKAFYNAKKYKLSESEIDEVKKNLKFQGNIDSVDFKDLDNYDYNYDFADDDEYRKIGSIRTFFKNLIEIISNQ